MMVFLSRLSNSYTFGNQIPIDFESILHYPYTRRGSVAMMYGQNQTDIRRWLCDYK